MTRFIALGVVTMALGGLMMSGLLRAGGPEVIPWWFMPLLAVVIGIRAFRMPPVGRYSFLVLAGSVLFISMTTGIWWRGVIWCLAGAVVIGIQFLPFQVRRAR
jgi:hypothetical protein